MIQFMPTLLAIKTCVGIVLVLLIFGAGMHYEGKRKDEIWAKVKSEEVQAVLTKERETRRAVDAITVASEKERENAKISIDKLQNDVRAGVVRLRIATVGCTERNTSAGNSEAIANILPTVASDLIGLAAECDQTVRELNETIDKWDALSK